MRNGQVFGSQRSLEEFGRGAIGCKLREMVSERFGAPVVVIVDQDRVLRLKFVYCPLLESGVIIDDFE